MRLPHTVGAVFAMAGEECGYKWRKCLVSFELKFRDYHAMTEEKEWLAMTKRKCSTHKIQCRTNKGFKIRNLERE